MRELHGDYKWPLLKEFEIDSAEVSLAELGTYLRNHFADIYSINWRRFEELVEDIYKVRGYRTVLTKPQKDGGADIIIMRENETDRQAIIECKRNKETRSIDVKEVRALVGALVDWNVSQAVLVTTSHATKPAQELALRFRQRGYAIDLVAASELLGFLGVYNEKVLPLNQLSWDLRLEMAKANQG